MNTLFCREGTHLSEMSGPGHARHITQALLRGFQNEPGPGGKGQFGVYLSPFSFSPVKAGADLARRATALAGLVLKGREITNAKDLV